MIQLNFAIGSDVSSDIKIPKMKHEHPSLNMSLLDTDTDDRIFVTCYMGTENSSEDTRSRAKKLSSQIGSYHLSIVIDTAVKAVLGIFSVATGQFPRFFPKKIDR